MNKISILVIGIVALIFCSTSVASSEAFRGAQFLKDTTKTYDAVITPEAISSRSFISVHKVGARYYFEIPDSVLGRDLFSVNRIVRSPQDWRHHFGGLCSFGNDWIGQAMFRFKKGRTENILLEVVSTAERAGEDLEQIVMRNNLSPAYANFPIKTYGKSDSGVVIDVTDYLGTDNAVFGYMDALKSIAMPIPFAADRSYIEEIRTYPANIEIKTVRSYSTPTSTLTGEYNSSLILLPKEPMRGRSYDERVGYLAVMSTEYKKINTTGRIEAHSNIWRWRLEPKPEDTDRYFLGELVEPLKPIVFYIDPATPQKWVPYLIEGVNDWQKAFERAGFKNAIRAVAVDPYDSTFDINDARHNVIVYKASAIGNAMGHTIQDPRSGELIESHIQWYHSLMEVLYKWYLTQAGAVDSAAQKPRFSDELMGELIRFVSSHEVGHALGLRHNWGASSTTTIGQLRNREWVEAHGHTPSIMDYARFNYVAQPEDSIGRKGIFPRIGDYDEWAIEWGYRFLPPATNDEEERRTLNKWIINKLDESERFRFGIGDDPSAKYPDNQREDLGDDAVEAGLLGIKNLKRIKSDLYNWVQIPGESYDHLEDTYKALVAQYEWYINHVTANVGGVVFTPKTTEQDGDVYQFYSLEKQKKAVEFLNTQLFQTPDWLRDERIYGVTNTDFSIVEAIQKKAIKKLIDPTLFDKLRSQEIADSGGAYTNERFLNDLFVGIFSELNSGESVSKNRRFIQNAYINELIAVLALPGRQHLDITDRLRMQSRNLMSLSRKASESTSNAVEKAHWDNIYESLFFAVEYPLRSSRSGLH